MKSNEHPINIATAFNVDMRCHDLRIIVGNFETVDDAKRYADRLKEFLEEEANADMGTIN